ncbi:MAG: hypothetical protein ABF608_02835 [Sporolactobacillus sp.]
MSALPIIFLVVAGFIYVAKQVDRQNTAAQKRREELQKHVTPPAETSARPQTVRQSSVKRSRPAQTMSTDLQNRYQNAQAKIQKVRPEAIVPALQPVPSRRTNRMTDRQAVRRAFLFAECIGKPRAIEPHRAFKHR